MKLLATKFLKYYLHVMVKNLKSFTCDTPAAQHTAAATTAAPLHRC